MKRKKLSACLATVYKHLLYAFNKVDNYSKKKKPNCLKTPESYKMVKNNQPGPKEGGGRAKGVCPLSSPGPCSVCQFYHGWPRGWVDFQEPRRAKGAGTESEAESAVGIHLELRFQREAPYK